MEELIKSIQKSKKCPDCKADLEIKEKDGKHPRVLITEYICTCGTFYLEHITHKW